MTFNILHTNLVLFFWKRGLKKWFWFFLDAIFESAWSKNFYSWFFEKKWQKCSEINWYQIELLRPMHTYGWNMKKGVATTQSKMYVAKKVVALDTVQDFLIKLGIKSHMHLWEITILLLNSVIIRPTKIMNRVDKNCAHFLVNNVL